MAQRAGGDDRARAVVAGVLEMPADEPDGDHLLGRCGVEAAALGAPRVVDRARAEDLVQLLERAVVARIEEAVMAGRPGEVATVEGRDVEAREPALHAARSEEHTSEL